MTGADGRLRGPSVQRTVTVGPRPASGPQRPVALLVVGDLDGDRLSRRLDPYFNMIATTNLPAAVAVLGDVRLDFVLIDAALPDPAMMELITQVRVRQWLRDLPIICYGSAAPGSPVSRLAGLAAHDVIVEPVTTEELISRIAAALPVRR